jgi:hypothetical protein
MAVVRATDSPPEVSSRSAGSGGVEQSADQEAYGGERDPVPTGHASPRTAARVAAADSRTCGQPLPESPPDW